MTVLWPAQVRETMLTFADLHLVLVDSSEAHGAGARGGLASEKQLFVHVNVQPVTLSLSVDQVELIGTMTPAWLAE